MAKYSISGREFDLVYNVHTMEAIEDEFGDQQTMLKEYRENRQSVKVLKKLFKAMANSGEWLAGREETVTGNEIDRLTLKGLDTLSKIVSQTMEESLRSETTGGNEADDEPYDMVLAEIEKRENEKNG